jgi:hypothetical protein
VKTSEVLRKAGDVLREHGWCQFVAYSPAGARCALGAINDGSRGTPGFYDAAKAILREEVLDLTSSGQIGNGWNDIPGRTVDEVLVAMDAAYVLALQEEGVEPEDVL